MEQINNRA